MSNKILKVNIKVPRETTLPDGLYAGTWGGYSIIIQYNQKVYECTTEEGVRGTGFKVMVKIEGDEMTFEELKN